MSTAAIAAGGTVPGAEFHVAGVFRRAFTVLSRHFLLFVGLSAINMVADMLFIAADPLHSTTPDPAIWLLSWRITLVSVVVHLPYFIAKATIAQMTFGYLRSRRVAIVPALRLAAIRLVPLILAWAVFILASYYGLILLIVPAILVVVRYYVFEPACVIERLGPIKCLRRSARLTKGNRWKILGIAAIMALPSLGPTIALIVVSEIGGGAVAQFSEFIQQPPIALFNNVLAVVVTAFSAVLGTVIYHDLRVAKEGIEGERVAAVFD